MYTNPRLKHVKKIEEIADSLRLAGKPATAKMITNQCNLLLETKKAKKRNKCRICGKKISLNLDGNYHEESLHRTISVTDTKEESKCECSCHEFGQVVHSGICKCGVMPETTSDAYDRKHPKEEMREIERFNSFEIEDMADEALAVRLNKVIDRVNILSKRK